MSLQQNGIASKRLELLRDVVPNLRRLAIIFDAGYPASVLEMGEVQAAARTLDLEVAPHEIRRAEDIAPVFDTLKSQADALYVVDDTLILVNRTPIITLALGAGLPTTFGNRDFVKAGDSCPTEQTFRLCSSALPNMSTKFCAGRSERPSGRAADQVRFRHQPQDRQDARSHYPADAPCHRRRGD